MFAKEIESYSRSKTLRQTHHKIARFEGKVNPAILQPNAPVPGTVQQIFSQQVAEIFQDRGIACRMQPMTAIIHPNPVELETACVAANRVALLQNRDPSEAVAGEFVRCPNSGRAGAKDDDVRRMLTSWLGYIH